jgi:hypothetical protein
MALNELNRVVVLSNIALISIYARMNGAKKDPVMAGSLGCYEGV